MIVKAGALLKDASRGLHNYWLLICVVLRQEEGHVLLGLILLRIIGSSFGLKGLRPDFELTTLDYQIGHMLAFLATQRQLSINLHLLHQSGFPIVATNSSSSIPIGISTVTQSIINNSYSHVLILICHGQIACLVLWVRMLLTIYFIYADHLTTKSLDLLFMIQNASILPILIDILLNSLIKFAGNPWWRMGSSSAMCLI